MLLARLQDTSGPRRARVCLSQPPRGLVWTDGNASLLLMRRDALVNGIQNNLVVMVASSVDFNLLWDELCEKLIRMEHNLSWEGSIRPRETPAARAPGPLNLTWVRGYSGSQAMMTSGEVQAASVKRPHNAHFRSLCKLPNSRGYWLCDCLPAHTRQSCPAWPSFLREHPEHVPDAQGKGKRE